MGWKLIFTSKRKSFFFNRYNQLSAVPASLANCTKIDEFNIEGNNVSELPVRTFRLYCQKIVFYEDLEREIPNETVR